jgi:hypothetical protein
LEDSQEDQDEEGSEYTDEDRASGEEYSDEEEGEEFEEGEFTDESTEVDGGTSEGRTTENTTGNEQLTSSVKQQSHTDELIMEIKQSIYENMQGLSSTPDENILAKSGVDTKIKGQIKVPGGTKAKKGAKSQVCEDSPDRDDGMLLLSQDSFNEQMDAIERSERNLDSPKNNSKSPKKKASKSPRGRDGDSMGDGPDLCR